MNEIITISDRIVAVGIITILGIGVLAGLLIGSSLTKLNLEEQQHNEICKYNGFDKELSYSAIIIKNKEYVLCEKTEVIGGNVEINRSYINTKPDMFCYGLRCFPTGD